MTTVMPRESHVTAAGAVLWQADVAAFGAVLQADAREGDRRLPVGGSSPERGHLAWCGHRLGRGPARLVIAPAAGAIARAGKKKA